MNKAEAIIFDLDGTLYTLDAPDFKSSRLGQKVKKNIALFLKDKFGDDEVQAMARYHEIKERYGENFSIAIEKGYGIPRSEYFSFTWNIEAAAYVRRVGNVARALQSLTVRSGILTAAPRIWADRVLEFLEIKDLIGQAIFTGEPDVRKPSSLAFQQFVDYWDIPASKIIAIGDQEESDILPANKLGMTTVRIGNDSTSSADFQAPDVIQALAVLKMVNRI